MPTRRAFLRGAAFSTLGILAGRKAIAQQHQHDQTQRVTAPAVRSKEGFLPVETPDLSKLPYQYENGVKVFHLIAEVVKTELIPGKTMYGWGYNGSVPGPTIEIVEGDRVRIIVDNHLPEPTSMHWHGLEVPLKMDGVPGISQPLIMPGGRYIYEFNVHQKGTFFYHSHLPMQEMMGMIGFFILHPKNEFQPRVDRDFGLILQEWALLPNNPVPNTAAMEFNWLTLNGKAGPAATPLIVKLGERVRIRFVNLGMDHHPMHLHGNTFYVTGTEGGRVPEAAWAPSNTVLVGVAQARDVEFDAKYPGEWMLHCHLPHHMMNQMVSMVGPMSHMGHGMKSGMSMETGMGMVMEGHATSDENGPSMGRSMGVGTTNDEATTHMVGQNHNQHEEHSSQDAKKVPGYPQDMWMTMDQEVAKPETYGLPEGWTGAMMGMMTLVRVLEPGLYNKVRELQSQNRKKQPAQEEHHG
jgi:FtsP/CotA-like multicopper oxidase with cupredoxin domain